MAKTILGVDIGSDSLKIVLMNGNQIKGSAIVQMPQSLIKQGRLVSVDTMSELFRDSLRQNGIHCKRAAIVLSNDVVFVRNVVMPRMSTDQLEFNLPYEFRDYITDELKDYVFDYAMISTPEELKAAAKQDAEQEPDPSADPDELSPGQTMKVMAAAVSGTVLEEFRTMFRKSGIQMVKAAPTESAYIPLIHHHLSHGEAEEFCILDLGYQAIRMHMFRGDRHEVTRVLEIGMSSLDLVIAEAYNVDIHLAHTYLLSNYDDCQSKEPCQNAYGNIAVELMRALNFYRFSNPDSQVNDVWLCGGGAVIQPLQKAIAETLDMRVHQADELYPKGKIPENSNALVQAVGITMN